MKHTSFLLLIDRSRRFALLVGAFQISARSVITGVLRFLWPPADTDLEFWNWRRPSTTAQTVGPHFPSPPISLRLGLTSVMNTNLSYPALLTLFPSANLVIDGFMLSKSCRGPLTSFGLRKWRNSRISKAIREKSIVSSRNTGDNFSNGMVRSIIKTGNNGPFFVGDGGQKMRPLNIFWLIVRSFKRPMRSIKVL